MRFLRAPNPRRTIGVHWYPTGNTPFWSVELGWFGCVLVVLKWRPRPPLAGDGPGDGQ